MEENKDLMTDLAGELPKQEELKTEVTSIANEELKTGEKIEVPGPKELVERASASFVQCSQYLANFFPKLSAKEKTRVFLAVLDLPQEGLPVKLKSDDEKRCYALGQKMQMDKFTLIYDSIVKEQTRIKDELAKKQVEKGNVQMLTEEQTALIKEDLKCSELASELNKDITNNIK